MDLVLKNLFDVFKVKDEAGLFKAKSEGKQTRFTMACHKPKMVELTADKCKKLCDNAGIEYQSGYEHRILEGLTTNETVDRYGDIVRHDGCKFDNYRKNPVVMLSHEHGEFPIGNSIQIWKDPTVKGIYSWDLYIDNRVDTTGRAEQAFKFRQSGIMPGISIGFIPLSIKSDHSEEERKKVGIGRWGVEFLSIDYLEHSQVSIPANPDALTNALKSADRFSIQKMFNKEDIFTLEKLKWFPDMEIFNIFEDYLKPDAVFFDFNSVLRPYPNEHACRLNDPSKYEEFRRGKRKHEGKEYSVIFGKLKGKDTWEEQAYRYAKDNWESDVAKKHCTNHGGTFEAAKGDKMLLDDGTILCHAGDNQWSEITDNAYKIIPKTTNESTNSIMLNKLEEVIIQLKSISDKLSSPAASKASEVEEVMYSSDLLKSFTIKPKV